MPSNWTVVDRASPPSVRSLGMLFVFPVLMAMAWAAPGVARHALLTIALTYTFLIGYWAVLRQILERPMAPDLCQRCGRGLITRVAATPRGDRFYRCAICGERYRRESRDGPWLEAAGPVDDVMYSRSDPDGLDQKSQQPIDQARYWTETISALRRNKRIRQIAQSRGRDAMKKTACSRLSKAARVQEYAPDCDLWDSELEALE
jgi:hypothetical protein